MDKYANEKISDALYLILIDEGDASSRLKKAFKEQLFKLHKTHFKDQQLWAEFTAIKNRIIDENYMKLSLKASQGKKVNTPIYFKNFQNRTASSLIKQLLQIKECLTD